MVRHRVIAGTVLLVKMVHNLETEMSLYVLLMKKRREHNDKDKTISSWELRLYNRSIPIASLQDKNDIFFLGNSIFYGGSILFVVPALLLNNLQHICKVDS